MPRQSPLHVKRKFITLFIVRGYGGRQQSNYCSRVNECSNIVRDAIKYTGMFILRAANAHSFFFYFPLCFSIVMDAVNGDFGQGNVFGTNGLCINRGEHNENDRRTTEIDPV